MSAQGRPDVRRFLALGPSYKGVLSLGRQARRRTGYEACRAVRSGGPIFLGVLGTFLGFSCFIYRHMCFLFVSALRTGGCE